MTITEAKEHLNKGLKVSHEYFTDNEFIQKRGGHLFDEKGNILNQSDFWKYRQGSAWENGWKVLPSWK